MKNFLCLIISAFMFSCTDPVVTELDGLQVPEGFSIERVVSSDQISYPMFATYDDKGRLFVFESTGINDMGTEVMMAEPSYHIRLLEDSNGDGQFDVSKIYADKIPFPMGGSFYNGSLYVAASPDYIKLTDADGDGQAEERETLLTGWVLNQNGAILSGPFMGPDGWMYMADARRSFDITNQEGEHFKGGGARIWRCKPDGSQLEWMSGGGFDNSIEIVFMPSGESIGTMTYFTEPQNGQRDALMHWVEGGVYPKPQITISQDGLPLTGELMPVMTKLPRVAPSGLMRYEGDAWGESFKGNLFSAEFNTGRIMRHVVSPVGATYATVDEAFITANKQDVHPTDVLQDADGSLLVLVTGGWFIKGCPLSQVAKPEVPGGIYRIRKIDSPKQGKDLWGNDIDFDASSEAELTELLTDNRLAVRKNAIEALIRKGGSAIPALATKMADSDAETRAAIVFACYRIGGADALALVRKSLGDEDGLVRVAAARCAGLAQDEAAISALANMVVKDDLAVRRQAATALGQIGNTSAVASLLKSVENVDDRVLEHSIIHALTKLGSVSDLQAGLKSGNPNVQKAALIALDQMKPSPLKESDLLPFLTSDNEANRGIGIWVASHRPAWSDVVEDFVKVGIQAEDLTDLKKLLLLFCGNTKIQTLLLKQLKSSKSAEQQSLILEVMRNCDVSDFPKQWQNALAQMLNGSDEVLQLEVLELLESRGLKEMKIQLTTMAADAKKSLEIRLKAMSARLMVDKTLTDSEFSFLTDLMQADQVSYTRQQAVRLISRSDLSDAQLIHLGNVELTKAEPFMLTGILDVFKGVENEAVGMAMVSGLSSMKEGLDNISMTDIEALLQSYPSTVADHAKPLVAKIEELQAERLGKLQDLEATLVKGDIGEGRKLFFGKAICSTCHAVGSEGSDFGPDLSNIGDIRSQHDILEAIVYPSVSFAREYDTYIVKTKDNSYTGVIKEQTGDVVVMSMGPGNEIRIPRADVLSISEHNVSMMPAGLDQHLSTEELSHLMAFLNALPYNLDRLIDLQATE
ncbi:PVC-type heme-binding CxxCH protein [Membranihabitans marinus]|uniref:PVC-type heme-binding CxxCH protein n=1 Tax=Membranihabitans marinus TaxID=1227546 RepID=UPI001F1E3520|nr:PVC-type heme-binding CxxCH protein [Membranihabitans marinus]